MQWISVGICGTTLAVLGAIVSILQFRGGKRYILAAVFLLLGVGECISIADAKKENDKKLAEQEWSMAAMRADEARNAGELAYMRAKLEDAQKLNEEYAPAIKQLAQTGADYMRKQYETRVETDAELLARTNAIVKQIRDFSRKYRVNEDNLERKWTSEYVSCATESERNAAWERHLQRSQDWSTARKYEFRGFVLPDALYARNELLRRNISEPSMSPEQNSEVRMVLGGMLAGPSPELQLADYLELMAKHLPAR